MKVLKSLIITMFVPLYTSGTVMFVELAWF